MWYVRYLGAHRAEGTKRSENLLFDKHLVQIQSDTSIKPPRTGEYDHIGLAVPMVSQAIQAAVDAGADRVSHDVITDPWGTRIQLVESERSRFHHVLINCSDPAESGEWYATHLGGEPETCPWNRDYLAIRYGAMWLAFGQGGEAGVVPMTKRPICHAGWITRDIDKTVEGMLASGCRFPVPVIQFGLARLAFAEDPSGLWVELIEPPTAK